MTRPILLIVAGSTIATAAVALPALHLMPPVSATAPGAPPGAPAGAAPGAAELVFTGMCDASAGLLVDADHLVVANDEDTDQTTLRVYDLRAPGKPVKQWAATGALKPETTDGEVDLEGLTRFGAQVVTIGSHSRKKKNPPLEALSRHRILAFTVPAGQPGSTIEAKGLYKDLIADAQRFLAQLPATEPMRGFVLDNKKGSKDGGLSIEAVTETALPGELLVGLRSPLGPGDKAIVLHLKNAADVLARGATASFAPPILLGLEGQGLRDLVRDGKGGYLLIAGDPGDGGAFSLWKWTGPGATPVRVSPIERPAGLTKASAEGLAVDANGASAWILFDEGERKNAAGVECKDLTDPNEQSFHARRIAVGGP
jgi:hypothetical protein